MFGSHSHGADKEWGAVSRSLRRRGVHVSVLPVLWAAVVGPLLFGVASAAPVVDRQAELWASSCAACHGSDGIGSGGFPALAGRDAGELLALLLRQRGGTADTTIMHQHAKGFSESELARIAAVFAARPKP